MGFCWWQLSLHIIMYTWASKRSFVLFFFPVRLPTAYQNKSIRFSSIRHPHEQLHIWLFNIRHSSICIPKNPGIQDLYHLGVCPLTPKLLHLAVWGSLTTELLFQIFQKTQAIVTALLLPLSLTDNNKTQPTDNLPESSLWQDLRYYDTEQSI